MNKAKAMYTTYEYAQPQTKGINFLWFAPCYFLLIAGAYILSDRFFPATIEKDKFFGYAFTKEIVFNETLFADLVIGIGCFGVIHFFSRLNNTSISTGNSVLALLLLINVGCFAIGVNIPMLHTQKFWIIKEHLSLIQVLHNLSLKQETQLYYIMLSFTFIIPFLKMAAMAYDIFISKADGRKNLLLSLLSKWAMLDVLVVTVIVATMKNGNGIAEMTTGTGLTFFSASVILSLIIAGCMPYTKNS